MIDVFKCVFGSLCPKLLVFKGSKKRAFKIHEFSFVLLIDSITSIENDDIKDYNNNSIDTVDSTLATTEPVVTLPHGGKLRGFTAPLANSMIDVYLGKSWIIPYYHFTICLQFSVNVNVEYRHNIKYLMPFYFNIENFPTGSVKKFPISSFSL